MRTYRGATSAGALSAYAVDAEKAMGLAPVTVLDSDPYRLDGN